MPVIWTGFCSWVHLHNVVFYYLPLFIIEPYMIQAQFPLTDFVDIFIPSVQDDMVYSVTNLTVQSFTLGWSYFTDFVVFYN